MSYDDPIPREMRTPITEAGAALNMAWDFFISLHQSANTPVDGANDALIDELKTAFDDPTTSGEKAIAEMMQVAAEKTSESDAEKIPYALLHVMFIVICFAVQAMKTAKSRHKKLAWSYACNAMYWAGILTGTFAIKAEPSPLVANARKAAIARIANDPRQKEKAVIYECWQAWQLKPDIYKSKAAFARDMLTKFDHLKSTKVIEDWCREWQTKTGTQQAE